MKLSNKLASLALAVAAVGSFCSFGIRVDAAPEGRVSAKVSNRSFRQNRSRRKGSRFNSAKDVKVAFNDNGSGVYDAKVEQKLNLNEKRYYDEGLNKT